MLTAMGGEQSHCFKRFQTYLARAFIILRRHSTLLFSALRGVLSAGIGDLSVTQSPEEAVRFLQSRLLPDLDDDAAGKYIQELAVENARALLPVVMDKMHEIASYFR
jgi:phosphatidylinositol 3-kinase